MVSALKFGAANAGSSYSESHNVTTDANGVFSLVDRKWKCLKAETMMALPWGSAAAFVAVSINGTEIGTTEMMAVPYAISSGDARQNADEVPYDNAISGLTATTTQDAIDELSTGGGVDADADPTNELQDISLAGTELTITDGSTIDLAPILPPGGTDDQNLELAGDVLSIEGGSGSVDLASYRDDADADATNEFQNLSFDAATNELSLTNGNTVTIPSGGTDADADPTNEIQTISFDAASNEITLTDGGTITIPSGGTDADADPTNEIQTISFDAGTNELSLSDGGTVTIPTGGTDADADPTNELQDISLAGTELTITDGSTIDLAPIVPPGGTDNQNLSFDETTNMLEIEDGNIVDLSSLAGSSGGSLWTEDEDGISRRSGVVGIGHQASLTAKLFVQNSTPGIRNGISASVFNPGFKVGISSSARSNDDELTYGMRSSVESAAGATSYAYRADMNGAGTGTKFAFFSRIHEGAGTKYGIYTDGEDKNYFSGNLGIGTENPIAKLEVDGDARISGEIHRVSTGNANMVPVAYGTVMNDGVIASGSGNFSVQKTAAGNYQIAIIGENYLFSQFTTTASLIGQIGFIATSSVSGRLIVRTNDSSGISSDSIFSFVVYKP